MADQNPEDPGKTGSEPGEDFLSRWSRRKRDAARANDSPAEPGDADSSAEEEEETDEGPTDADLPPVESLGPDSDYSAYLSGRVSEQLRQAALRKLFRQPVFNVRDGLDDYDDDYRSFAALGETITADMRHHRERLREKASRAEEAETAAEEDRADAAHSDSDATPSQQQPDEIRTENSEDPGDNPAAEPAPRTGNDTSDTDPEHE